MKNIRNQREDDRVTQKSVAFVSLQYRNGFDSLKEECNLPCYFHKAKGIEYKINCVGKCLCGFFTNAKIY